MIPDDTVDRYYYIFDSREGRAVVMDRTTGREFVWADTPQAPLIDHVRKQRSERSLRRFARWCARQTGAHEGPVHAPTGRMWAAVRGRSSDGDRVRVREATAEAAVLAASLGLPRRRAEAARLLTVHACTHPEARRAALDAAHMSERWAEFEADTEPSAAVRRLRRRQINWLLDALGNRA